MRSIRYGMGLALATALLAGALAQDAMGGEPTTFVLRLENVSTDATLVTPDGTVAVPLSPGVWTLHEAAGPLFAAGEGDRGQGLEALAEDGDPSALAAYLAGSMMGGPSGAFATPVGASAPGPIGPGGAYEVTFEARPGDRLTLATMFVQSNDWFYAPGPEGIALFGADGAPVAGDVTDAFRLWDAGTEADEPAGVGADQAPRQMGPNSGASQMGPVSEVMGASEVTGPVLRVTLQPQGGM